MADLMEGWSRTAKLAAACGAVEVFGALILLNRQKPQVWTIEDSVLLVLLAMAVAAPVLLICLVILLARRMRDPSPGP